MVETMPRRKDSTQTIIARGKNHAIANFFIRLRHALAIKGIDRDMQTTPQGNGTTNMIGMTMRNQNATNIVAFSTLADNRFQVLRSIITRINHGSSLDTTPEHNR